MCVADFSYIQVNLVSVLSAELHCAQNSGINIVNKVM
jgi:hypothetical protein